MSNKDTGGPAFPTMQYEHGGDEDGISMRDYFAAKAMQGMFSSGNLEIGDTNKIVSEAAYKVADAMLEARKK